MHNVPGRSFICLIGLLCGLIASGQQITVKGGFVQDSLKVGENIQYWLTANYPENLELILPDTTFDFSPFEFAGKAYFPSRINDGRIMDSAVYTLQSYEIDQVQRLALPALILDVTGDSTAIMAKSDSIFLKELAAPVVSDTTQLKTNLAYQQVFRQFNYPLMWIIIGVVVLILAGVYFFLGGKIRRTLLLRKLRKEYSRFSEELTINIRSLREQPDRKVAEHTLAEWKNFLERLENEPFSKLTTKEIMAMDYTKELKSTLKNIDRCVYGGLVEPTIYKDFQDIEDFTQHRYSVITNGIKNN